MCRYPKTPRVVVVVENPGIALERKADTENPPEPRFDQRDQGPRVLQPRTGNRCHPWTPLGLLLSPKYFWENAREWKTLHPTIPDIYPAVPPLVFRPYVLSSLHHKASEKTVTYNRAIPERMSFRIPSIASGREYYLKIERLELGRCGFFAPNGGICKPTATPLRTGATSILD